MQNKKASAGFPIEFIFSLILFIFTLIIFSILFFSTNLIKSPNLIIKSEAYQDSSKLINILRSETNVHYSNKNLVIGELISLSYQDEKYKQNLKEEVAKLLSKLPKPPKEKDTAEIKIITPSAVSSSLQESYWLMDIEIDGINFINIGEQSVIGKKLFVQNAVIPLSNQKSAKITLYLDCFSCSQEGIDAIA